MGRLVLADHGIVADESIAFPIACNSSFAGVAELPEYLRAAGKLLTDADRHAVVEHLAAYPIAGALIEGIGGVRKLRWARDGRGKSGGVRVIYYFHSEAMPLYLLAMFAKNERANLCKAERNALAGLVDDLVQLWFER